MFCDMRVRKQEDIVYFTLLYLNKQENNYVYKQEDNIPSVVFSFVNVCTCL